MSKKADLAFEVSWEVCNKVGGIFTVVKSKAAKMVENYGENYYMIGPYFPGKTTSDFKEEFPDDFCKDSFKELKEDGLICHVGRWTIEGNPKVILIDFNSYRGRINSIKKEFWEKYGIDSMRAPPDYDEPVSWAYSTGAVIDKISKCFGSDNIVAHFHEWLSGAGLLYLKSTNSRIATVFTTHATVLGRTMASNHIDLYNVWDKIDADKEAHKNYVEAKHGIEKSSAHNADVFSTVSEITGMEAEHLIKKKPDILLPNGLDISKFPSFEELAIEHRTQKNRIYEFLISYFFPYYSFDINETLIFFIAARNEYRDKGIDIYLKSLGRLNEDLKKSGSKKTIAAFVWVPANIRNIKSELLENKTLYEDIKDSLEDANDEIGRNIMYTLVSHNKITGESILNKKVLGEVKSKIAKFVKKGSPPVSTHDLYDQDAILDGITEANLQNKEDDRVKIIFQPIYLTGADGLINLNYYEAMQGSHLGIFPSYYEPWGYTPMEAGALGVASITTDLAGFGRYFCDKCVQPKTPGIFVLERLNKSDDEVIGKLTQTMHDFVNFSTEERVANKLMARESASMADWKSFVNNYIEAHNMAIEKHRKG